MHCPSAPSACERACEDADVLDLILRQLTLGHLFCLACSSTALRRQLETGRRNSHAWPAGTDLGIEAWRNPGCVVLWRCLLRNLTPAGTIEAARSNLIDGFPLRVASNRQIAEYIAMIGFYDLPLDYLDSFTTKVAAVTPAAVKDAFTRRLPLKQLTSVVVGRAAHDDKGS